MSETTRRKADHLELCATEAVGFRTRTHLLEDMELVHNALPELSWDELNTAVTLWGRNLKLPLVIAAMSGGTPEAAQLNQALARVAARYGLGLGLGSQRIMLETPAGAPGFQVRELAPDILLLGNLGAVQAARLSTQTILERLVKPSGIDALCLHLNPAQELIQPGGDRDFRGILDAIRRLADELPIPLVVKETGCGLSRGVGKRLLAAGVRAVDISGAGGTSWVGVETLRSQGPARELGSAFWDWGIPTAASLCQLSGLGLTVMATGGISSGLEVAKSLVLGATVAGVARPFLKAWREGGEAGLEQRVEGLRSELLLSMLLTGSPDLNALRSQPCLIGSRLRGWIPAESPLAACLAAGPA